MITSHWGCWVSSLLTEKKEKRGIYQKEEEKSKGKARLNLYNYVLFTPFRVSSRCGRGWVAWILPAGGEVGFLWLLLTEVLGFWLLPKRRRKREKLYIYIYTKKK